MADQGTEGFFSPILRERRLSAALPYVNGLVLDFGCGGGLLAAHCPSERYLGVDRDPAALTAARSRFPRHQFQSELPPAGQFDTIVALAVIEHLKSPLTWVTQMKTFLGPCGSLVLTTPHPAFRSLHDFGARIGFFSHEASAEHETFLNHQDLRQLAEQSGLRLACYHRFLLGANQLAVFSCG